MKRLLVIFVMLLLFLAGSIYVVLSGNGSVQESGDRVRLQLQWFDQAQFAGFYVAKEKGFYRQRGLNVEIVPGGYATKPVDVVDSGQADIAVSPMDTALQAIGSGKSVKVLGTVFDRSLVCFMSKKQAMVKTPVDFTGKVVGIYQGQDTENVLQLLLRKLNINPQTVDIRPAGQIPAFEKGDFDVWPSYRINEPLRMEAKGVPVDCLKPEDFGIAYYSDTLITAEGYAAGYPSRIKEFMQASAEGWQYALDHPDEVVPIMYRANLNLPDGPGDREHQVKMLGSTLQYVRRPSGSRLFSISRDRLEGMVDAMADAGLLPKQSKERIMKSVDRSAFGS